MDERKRFIEDWLRSGGENISGLCRLYRDRNRDSINHIVNSHGIPTTGASPSPLTPRQRPKPRRGGISLARRRKPRDQTRYINPLSPASERPPSQESLDPSATPRTRGALARRGTVSGAGMHGSEFRVRRQNQTSNSERAKLSPYGRPQPHDVQFCPQKQPKITTNPILSTT